MKFVVVRVSATVAFLASTLAPCVLPVSAAAGDARLAARLDPATVRIVTVLADSARAENLPAEALIQRALEGVTKGATVERITLAVRGLLHRLRESRRTLGSRATSEELVAAASALQVGVPAASLTEMRDARPGSLTVPLVVLADLVGRGVQVETATATVLFMARAGVEDDRFLDFRNRVEKDIGSGVSPGTAATIRAGGTVTGSRGAPPGRRIP